MKHTGRRDGNKSLLESLNLPNDLHDFSPAQLAELATEIRTFMLKTVAGTGGHLAPSLGVVELALALHSTFNSPRDRIIWDVGHQCYVHKILTGRRDRFHTLRRPGGLSGFPRLSESEHDPFGTGHASTSVSAALGLALARDHYGEKHRVIAVIGDGALTGGMAYEALNFAGHAKTDLLIILNDNKMSISRNVGAMSDYLQRLRTDPNYSRLKGEFEKALRRVPLVGEPVISSAQRLRGGLKYLLMPGMLFEELGLTYLGPVDGHNIRSMKNVFERAARLRGPILLHVITEKGKGYSFAEKSPERFHGIGPFDLQNGQARKHKKPPSYTEIFSRALVDLATADEKIVAVTAAMTAGTGLEHFSLTFPKRFFDVGIAEQHGVTMAAAMAAGGLRPVMAIYSTFLQRAFDQLIHDVSLQNLPVVLAVDRAGIVGEDGETHQGLFDLSYLRLAPNMAVLAPRNEDELQHALHTAIYASPGPAALRYPRAYGEGVPLTEPQAWPWGKGILLREGEDILIVAAGTVTNAAFKAAEMLYWQGIRAAVIDARFVKPLDEELIMTWARRCRRVLTVEENILAGGFGSAVGELLVRKALVRPLLHLGIGDRFVEHGPRNLVLERLGLDAGGIYRSALAFANRSTAEGSR